MLYLGIDQHAKQLTVSLRDEVGSVVQSRQVSTEPLRCLEFLTKLKELAGASGYVAIVEVCGFNDWLLELLPKFGCIQTVLIQPEKKSKVKTDHQSRKYYFAMATWPNDAACVAQRPTHENLVQGHSQPSGQQDRTSSSNAKGKCRHSQHAGRASTLRPMSKNHGRPSKKTSHPKPGKNRQAIHSGGILIRYFQRSIFQELAPKEKAF